ncbi:MAG TPA: hypothetical protein GYA08_03670 [Chloroflexi bacterium]|nr:hypothetical protein [Chloroflexota bacterium]
MGKTWLYQFFKIGGVPAGLRAKLAQEGIVLLDEGIGGTITYHNFRAPGRAYGWKKSWFSGAVALTNVRFVAFAYGRQVINVPWDDPRRAQLRVSCEASDRLLIAFDPAIFHTDWSGTVEVRLSTALAQQLHARLIE